jgi:hypothetical protein
MRGIEAVLLAGFIGLVVIGIRNAREWLPLRGTQAAYSAPIYSTPPTHSKAESQEKTAAKKTQPRVKRDLDRAIEVSATNNVVITDAPKPKATEALVLSVVPTRNDLHAGATGVQIRSQFGDPTARVTESRDGGIVEQYYYFNHDRTQVTVATLKAGVIVSAASTLP